MSIPALKLIYLDHHYWRAECTRVACHIAGVPLDDARMGYDGMYASGALTFGTFPALVVEGKGVLNQTQAIARYVGGLCGLYPSDPFLAAKADEAIDALTDCPTCDRHHAGARPSAQDPLATGAIAQDGRMTMIPGHRELSQNSSVSEKHVAGPTWSPTSRVARRGLALKRHHHASHQTTRRRLPRLWGLHVAVDALPKVVSGSKLTRPYKMQR